MMSNTKELLELALEAVLVGFKAEQYMKDEDYALQDKAVISIKQALSAPVQEIEYCNAYHCAGDCGQPHNQKEMRDFLTAQPAPVQSAEREEPVWCGHCNGSGRMVRDPDIGTDQECFVCDGTGVLTQIDNMTVGLTTPPAPVLPHCEHDFKMSPSYGGYLCAVCGKPERRK
jgi:DnaJ-class molecular chaperone